mmetsp:Transcript_33742/g.38853  ORF Transcript_33742/g.38853 Transcript_33742/m.38853 type:complete len:121 (-) Transcript_33742:595-957(-)
MINKAIGKVKKMLQYLKHGNRSTFDLKIIQGLFEEYVSDSEEEDNINRALNTEEEFKEFYSFVPPPPDDPKRIARGSIVDKFDLTSLRNLYKKEDGIISIGGHTKTEYSRSPDLKKYDSK